MPKKNKTGAVVKKQVTEKKPKVKAKPKAKVKAKPKKKK